MTRDQAYSILTKHLSNPNLIKHSLAAEAAMRSIYKYLYKNNYNSAEEEIWGITGLLHDGDYEKAKDIPQKHGLLLFELEPSIEEPMKHAIQGHNPLTGVEPVSDMDWAIRAAGQLTGLITAAALVRPDKKLESVTTDSVVKRFGEKAFARGADRNSILLCEEKLTMPLHDFVEVVLQAMQGIHTELGL